MRFATLILLPLFFLAGASWETDFEKAKDDARTEHKMILLNFSGSDWCGPCINLKKEIFDNNVFLEYASDHLVLVNADFPRLKKHQLSVDQQSKNDKLADAYNNKGIFPLTILMTADGRVIKKWEGFPNVSPGAFTNEIKSLAGGNN